MCAAIHNHDLTFEVFDKLMQKTVEELKREGEPIVRYRQRLVTSHLKHLQKVTINGVTGKGCSCSVGSLRTQIGEAILLSDPNCPFAAIWNDTIEGIRFYSLRSRRNGFNVGEMAKSFGGGGHYSASAFGIEYQATIPNMVEHEKI